MQVWSGSSLATGNRHANALCDRQQESPTHANPQLTRATASKGDRKYVFRGNFSLSLSLCRDLWSEMCLFAATCIVHSLSDAPLEVSFSAGRVAAPRPVPPKGRG